MWIEEYRNAHGLSVSDLEKKVLALSKQRAGKREAHVGVIISRLERDDGFVTVPGLADLIAKACDATQEQRDTLVLKKYRKKRRKCKSGRHAYNRKPVEVVDAEGKRLATFESATSAGLAYNVSVDYVARRCRGQGGDCEFSLVPVTFRYIKEGEQWQE